VICPKAVRTAQINDGEHAGNWGLGRENPTKRRERHEVEFEEARCDGFGFCEEVAPEVFRIDEDGNLQIS